MPCRPSHQCPGRGLYSHNCRNTIRGNDRYCPACTEIFDKEQKKRNERYDQTRAGNVNRKFIHSPEWRKIRLRKLAQDPLCEKCLEIGRDTRATVVHHIDSDELNNSPDNHMSLCNDHHEIIHKHDRWGKNGRQGHCQDYQ